MTESRNVTVKGNRFHVRNKSNKSKNGQERVLKRFDLAESAAPTKAAPFFFTRADSGTKFIDSRRKKLLVQEKNQMLFTTQSDVLKRSMQNIFNITMTKTKKNLV